MNRKRCPWCGKMIDRKKDTQSLNDLVGSPSVPRMLRQAKCGHCHHTYGQVPPRSFDVKIGLAVMLLLAAAFIFRSGVLFVLAFAPVFLFALTPYVKLEDTGRPRGEDAGLRCAFTVTEQYERLKPGGLYFLENSFDDFPPFSLVPPIRIRHVSRRDNTVYGEFLYRHVSLDSYCQKDSCPLYDTDGNPAARITFRETPHGSADE